MAMFEEEDIYSVCTYEDKTIRFEWVIEEFGFGETTFYYKDGKLMCDSETLSKESIKKILCAFVDKAELIS